MYLYYASPCCKNEFRHTFPHFLSLMKHGFMLVNILTDKTGEYGAPKICVLSMKDCYTPDNLVYMKSLDG